MTTLARGVGHAAGVVVKAAQDLTGSHADTAGEASGKAAQKATPPPPKRSSSKKHSTRKGRRKASASATAVSTGKKLPAGKKKIKSR
jgi:hypothetical protein